MNLRNVRGWVSCSWPSEAHITTRITHFSMYLRYLWVGLMLMDLRDLPNKHLLNMDVAVVGDVGGDTAAAMPCLTSQFTCFTSERCSIYWLYSIYSLYFCRWETSAATLRPLCITSLRLRRRFGILI
jgi:hypothetical protein